MPSVKQKKFWYLFFTFLGLLGLGLNIYAVATASEQNANFKKFFAVFWIIAFVVLIYDNVTKLRKLSKKDYN